MKTLLSAPFILKQIKDNLFKVYRNHYDIGVICEYGTVTLCDEIVLGVEKKPYSGYWQEVVRQCIEKQGKLYEKYKKEFL